MYPAPPQDPWAQVAEVVRLVRQGRAGTRPELADATRLGRNVITQRVRTAQRLGLLRPSGRFRSRGGRAAEEWEFAGGTGRLLVAVVGARSSRVAATDLDLRVLEDRRVEHDPADGALATCERIAAAMDALVRRHHPAGPAWGVGIGLPAAVDRISGRVLPPVAPGAASLDWPADLDVRGWFTRRMQAPVWTESVTTLAAMGAAATPGAPGDLVFLRMDRGVGGGVVTDGRPHRGADGIAGQIAHLTVQDAPERICRCGRTGCLDAYASEWAIEAEALRAVELGRATVLTGGGPVTLERVVAGAGAADPVCAQLLLRAADATGRALAGVVTWFNPRRVVLGGNALAGSALFRDAVERSLRANALAASARGLELVAGDPQRAEEVAGAASLVVEALLSPGFLAEWGPAGFPVDVERLLAKHPWSLA